MYYSGVYGPIEVYFDNIQFETESYATTFAATNRSATDGLVDLVGSYNGDLDNIPFSEVQHDLRFTASVQADDTTIPFGQVTFADATE